jgi:hypothetical protein
MANVKSLTDKLSELTIKPEPSSTSTSASSNKLQSKYQGIPGSSVRPTPATVLNLLGKKTSSSTLNSASASGTSKAAQASASTITPAPTAEDDQKDLADIGEYDGGFESEMDGGRGTEVDGEAAEALALDSSTNQ